MNIKYDKKAVNAGRRKALASAAGVAGVAAVWQTPLINSVILPAHAQMSAVTNFFGATVGASPTSLIERSPLDLLIQPAYAGQEFPEEYTISVVQTAPGGDTFDIGVFERLEQKRFATAEVLYGGQATTGAGGNLAVDGNPCELEIGSLAVEVGDINADSIVLNFPDRAQTVTVPVGDGVLPMPMCVESNPNNFSLIDFDLNGGASTGETHFSPIDLVVPPAFAGPQLGSLFSMTAVRKSATVFTITFQDQINDLRWSGDISDDGTVGTLAFGFDCIEFGDVNARIDSVTFNQLVLSVELEGFIAFTLFPGLLPLPDICAD